MALVYNVAALPGQQFLDPTLTVGQAGLVLNGAYRVLSGITGTGMFVFPNKLARALKDAKFHVDAMAVQLNAHIRGSGNSADMAGSVLGFIKARALYLVELTRIDKAWNAWVVSGEAPTGTTQVVPRDLALPKTEPEIPVLPPMPTATQSLGFLGVALAAAGIIYLLRR